MADDLPALLSSISRDGQVSDAEVLAIRRIIYPDGIISLQEADWLFDLNAGVSEPTPAWTALFVEALTDYMVNQLPPQGHVAPENVDWLLAHIRKDGEVRRETELELLVNILEKSISAPDPLAVYTLGQVKAEVLRSNRLGAKEVQLMRRVLYAAGGQKNIAITRQEADVIYDIHDARPGEDDPEWLDLFAKVMLNHLMFASGFEPPSRELALQPAKWLDDTTVDVSRFMGEMASSLVEAFRIYRTSDNGFRDLMAYYFPPDFKTEYLAKREAIQAQAEIITDKEASWLAARIERDGELSAAERLLLDLLRKEQVSLHPLIQAAINKLS